MLSGRVFGAMLWGVLTSSSTVVADLSAHAHDDGDAGDGAAQAVGEGPGGLPREENRSSIQICYRNDRKIERSLSDARGFGRRQLLANSIELENFISHRKR